MPASNDIDHIIWPDRATILHDSRCDGVADAVETILDGSDATLITKNINANGTYLASSDNADGYSSVTVEVPSDTPTLITKSISANGTYSASDDSADGYSEVSVDVQPTLRTVTRDRAGTVKASDYGVDGFSEVTVYPMGTSDLYDVKIGINFSPLIAPFNIIPSSLCLKTMHSSYNGKVIQNGLPIDQTSTTVTTNGTVDTTLISSLTVNVPTGGGGTVKGDVNFYDYDGTIVNSYSAAEFAQLSEMPDNPTHEGLTPQGWNWTLTDAKTYVASYGKLDIGQMYVTSDGKTRLYITLTEGRTSPILKLTLASDSEVDIDWGDGTNHETLTSTSGGNVSSNRHEYASVGSYVISITVSSGSVTIPQYVLSDGNSSAFSSPDRAYLNAIKKVEIGSSITSFGSSAFGNCSSLSSITIPNSVTSIGDSAFADCTSISSITIPNTVTSIGSSVFQSCSTLSSITIPSGVTSIGNIAFQSCYSLSSITIPSGVTSISTYTFNSCTSLSSITIPSSVTSIGNGAFQNCSSLSSITIPNNVTSIASMAFQGCYSLSSITIPNSVTSFGNNTFKNCYSLATITILGKSSGDIPGSPWGATTGSPTNTQIIWENDQ